jgi:hypothetical protein
MSSTCALSCTFLESVTSRSPHEDDPPSSEGSNGESDYGNSRDEAMKKRVLLRNRGRPVSDTEDEDRLAEDEMNAEVVADVNLTPATRHTIAFYSTSPYPIYETS